MVALAFPDGTRIRDRQVEEAVLREAHARWFLARQATEEAAQEALREASQVTVGHVCLAYRADATANGAEQTYEVRADTLLDFCFGLPARFRSKDAAPNPSPTSCGNRRPRPTSTGATDASPCRN